MDNVPIRHGKYIIYRVGDKNIKVFEGSHREAVLKAVFKAPEVFTSRDIAKAAKVSVLKVSEALLSYTKQGLVIRTKQPLLLPDTLSPEFLYTIYGKVPEAWERYLLKAFKGQPNILKAYDLIKTGGVYSSVELHEKIGPFPASTLKAVFVKVGLLGFQYQKIADFYYVPSKISGAALEKEISLRYDEIAKSRAKAIKEGYNLERETLEFLNNARGRLAFVLTDVKRQVVKEIDGRRRIFDAVCYFDLCLYEGKHKPNKWVDVKYSSGKFIAPVECKNRKVPISAAVLDEMILDSQCCYGTRTMPIMVGDIGNSAWEDMRRYPAVMIPLKQLKQYSNNLKGLNNGKRKEKAKIGLRGEKS